MPKKFVRGFIFTLSIAYTFYPANLLSAQEVSAPAPAVENGQITPLFSTGNTSKPEGMALTPSPAAANVTTVPPEAAKTKSIPEKKPAEVESESGQKTKETATQKTREEKSDRSEIERLLSGRVPGTVSTDLQQFGYNLFQQKVSTFAPVTDVPVGPDYIIGPGDSFSITVWGKVEATYTVDVDRDGKIILPEVGEVAVWGLTFAELKNVLKTELSKYMQGFQLNVTMRKLRTILVYMVGKVNTPGSYSLSSLSTMINALFAAGGPTREGSLRNIQVIRNGQVIKTVDLYDFLLKGDKSQDQRLQPGDTIFVPVIGEVAGIAGNVKVPAIYEMKERLNIEELIKLAGGIRPTGYLQRVQVERVVAHKERIVVDLNLSSTMENEGVAPGFIPGQISGGQAPALRSSTLEGKEAAQLKTKLQDGDMVKIFPIATLIKNFVSLEGHVVRPGEYELKEGLRLSNLITSYDDLLPEPYLEYAEVIRLEEPDLHQRLIPFSVGEVLKKNPAHDIPLQRFDRVVVYSKWNFENKYQVKIEGEVRQPGTFPLLEGTKISDLVKKAGGLTKEAYSGKTEIFRLTPEREIKTIPLDLGKALEGDPQANIILQDEDRVVIHNIWETKGKETVNIIGEINKPGEYRLTQDMRISDLVFRAGNCKDNAYLRDAELTRMIIDQEGVKTEQLEINLEEALRGNSRHNLLLQKYDTLKVRVIPDWEKKRVVTVKGEVRFPGMYNIGKEERLSSLIKRAGGYAGGAYLRGAIFTRESVKEVQRERLNDLIKKQELEIQTMSAQISGGTLNKDDLEVTRQTLAIQQELLRKLKESKVTGRIVVKLLPGEEFAGSEYDIKLRDGDELTIPMKPDTVEVVGEVYNPTSIICGEGKTVSYYLNKVGGATKDADDDEIYLIRADGSVVSRSQGRGFLISWDSEGGQWISGGFMSTRLEPGDTILVPRKLEKTQWLKSTSEITQILYQIAVTTAITMTAF